MVLLGELMRQYSVNPFALPENARLRNREIPDTVEARTAAWIIESVDDSEAGRLGLASGDYRQLNLMRSAFADYLWWAGGEHDGLLYRALSTPLGPAPPPLGPPRPQLDEARRETLLLAFFAPLLGIQPTERLVLSCPPAADPPPVRVADGSSPPPPPPPRQTPPARIAIRGQIDDLTARPGTNDFKKASSATLAFTDNNEAGTTSFAINGVLALGTNVGTNNSLYGFVQYTLNDQETDAVGDDDDTKDIHNLSPGIFYRHPFAFGRSVYGTLGLTGYATFDLRNDAQLVRARLLYSDIAIALPVGSGFLCGQERALFGLFYADCRLGAFVEAAEVLDAGRNADLLVNGDDEYFGAGGEVSLILSPQGPAFLRPLSFRANYRAMAILSGALDNPERLELSLTYTSPTATANRQAYSFGISRVLGENFETFQHEDLWKLTLGLKF